MAIMVAVAIPAMASTASSQTRRYENRNERRVYQTNRYNNRSNQNRYGYSEPNVYDKHRKAVNIGVGTGVGAIIGALLGGKKGALVGGAAGAVGGYVVTKKQAPRNPNHYQYRY